MDRLEDCKMYYERNKKVLQKEGYASDIKWGILEIERLRKVIEDIKHDICCLPASYCEQVASFIKQALKEE